MYCLMPDHLHFLWMGLRREADQRLGARFLRKHVNRIVGFSGCKLQKQPYDNILRERDRERDAFAKVAWYIRANPLRAGLVASEDELASYPYSGCLVPGYPELDITGADYWQRLWRIQEYLRESHLSE